MCCWNAHPIKRSAKFSTYMSTVGENWKGKLKFRQAIGRTTAILFLRDQVTFLKAGSSLHVSLKGSDLGKAAL